MPALQYDKSSAGAAAYQALASELMCRLENAADKETVS
jgi:hypothetical protein